MSSGTAGTARRPVTSAAPGWPTIARLGCACGPTRCPNAETKVTREETASEIAYVLLSSLRQLKNLCGSFQKNFRVGTLFFFLLNTRRTFVCEFNVVTKIEFVSPLT